MENEDADSGETRETITAKEMQKAMYDVSSDLVFTMETEQDFDKKKRLPTLSFEMW